VASRAHLTILPSRFTVQELSSSSRPGIATAEFELFSARGETFGRPSGRHSDGLAARIAANGPRTRRSGGPGRPRHSRLRVGQSQTLIIAEGNLMLLVGAARGIAQRGKPLFSGRASGGGRSCISAPSRDGRR
jgi:hypothetical protein